MCLGCNAQRLPLDISEASQLCAELDEGEEASQTQSMMRHLVFDDSSSERQSIENKEQQFCDGEQVAPIEETTKACINKQKGKTRLRHHMLRLGVNAAYWQKIGWLAAPFALTPAAMDRWKSAQAVRRSFACGLIHQPGQGKGGGRTARILAGADASALSYLTPEHSIDLSFADFSYGFERAGGVSDWLVKFLACEHAWQQAEQADEAAEQTGQQHIKVAHWMMGVQMEYEWQWVARAFGDKIEQ